VLPRGIDIADGVHRYVVHWVGLGIGTTDRPRIQAGTGTTTFGNGAINYYLWIEDAPKVGIQQIATVVHPGDHVYVHVHQVAGHGQFHITDAESGFDRSYSLGDANIAATSSQAEWIHERPTVNGIFPQLARTQVTTFTGARAAGPGSGWVGLSSLSHYFDVMLTCNGQQQMAHPGPLANNAFQAVWDAAGHNDHSPC
jgi:hypothetical protein